MGATTTITTTSLHPNGGTAFGTVTPGASGTIDAVLLAGELNGNTPIAGVGLFYKVSPDGTNYGELRPITNGLITVEAIPPANATVNVSAQLTGLTSGSSVVFNVINKDGAAPLNAELITLTV